ncbi:DNA polymerase [Mesorhizobium sp. L2C067A000]|uniref:DNA polymerase n=1 Tax=Mesorhizobium sp. L2C067A000 TaxID=1287106 RepID=UPI00041712ED|nr:DNA polymerase [Mesorhizobium sp. L2C067A000]
MAIYTFDIEGDGLLDTITKLHCLWLKDFITGERFDFADQPGYRPIADGLRMLMEADLIVGHNIIKFDIAAIQKLYPWFVIDETKVVDTVVASRMIWTNLVDADMANIRANRTTLTASLAGWHSLEAWGHRLGLWKGDYSKNKAAEVAEERGLDPKKDEKEIMRLVWAEWSPEMHEYCGQDVEVTEAFYRKVLSKKPSQQAMEIEMGVCFIIAQMERNGFGFNVENAEKLLHQLQVLRAELAESLRSIFKPWYVRDGKPWTPKKDNAKFGYMAGCSIQKIKLNVFNPNSNDQIADRFIKLYGWKPIELTPSGKPKLDETVLEDLPYPEAKELYRYKMIQKRIGQIAEGDQAWLSAVKPDGNVYTTTNTGGTVSGRASHSNFNVGQVPSCDKEFGPECRECFGPTTKFRRLGWKQLGCDVSGLELRMLGHFMYRHDDGEYANEVVNGDVHTKNQKAAGLPSRSIAKRWFYAFLYGSGLALLGLIAGGDDKLGRKLKRNVMKGLPALKALIDGIKKKVEQTKSLRGLDGRILFSRSPHSALNLLLQSAGAVMCKLWIIEFVKLLKEHNLYQTKVRIMAWVHDELQMEIAPDLIREDGTSIVGELCVKAIEKAGQMLNLRVPLTGEYKIGNNWKDCH